jgi:Uma2 family endonuclease
MDGLAEDANWFPCDEPRYENFGDGPVAMSGASIYHDAVVVNLIWLFGCYLRGNMCKLYTHAVKVMLKSGKWFYPDVSVVCDRSRVSEYHIDGSPDLVVEVLSPSTAPDDLQKKLPAYFENGAKEVWIVSPRDRIVYVYGSVAAFEVFPFVGQAERENISEEKFKRVARDQVESKVFPEFRPLLSEIFYNVG